MAVAMLLLPKSKHLFHKERKGTQFPAKELQISYILRTRATIPINSEKYSFYIERWEKFGIFFCKLPIVAEKCRYFSATMTKIRANHQKTAIVTEIPDNFSVTMTGSTIFRISTTFPDDEIWSDSVA